MKKILFVISFFAFINTHAQELNIIPKPSLIVLQMGSYNLDKNTDVRYDFKKANLYQKNKIEKYANAVLKEKLFAKLGRVYIRFSDKLLEEEYKLDIGPNHIAFNVTERSISFALETLRQLIETSENSTLKNCIIGDVPRFSYRGMHLDVGRHFQPVSFIKKYIDYLAMYKFNTFHWHLTEDQGWRIEIKKYPKLTFIGGWRNGTITGRYPGTGNTNEKYGGFYTQAEIKEVVQYATDRNITIIPEIELPGHSSAAIAAYPELSCFPNEPTKIPNEWISDASKNAKGKLVQETWGVFEDVFCPKETTFQFLQNVLDEVMALFPGKYIHIGGDECPKENWKKCSSCQQLIKDKSLKDEHELQSYFIQRIEKYINSKGKNIIGWDEILEGGLAPNATVMSWRGEKGGIEAAQQKHTVVMTPGSHCYFDHSQSRNEDSVTIGGYTTVEKVYAYEPVPKELTKEEAKYVLGAQGNVWTEYMNNSRKIEYQIFPRMLALSEVLWSDTTGRKWEEFEPRLLKQMSKLEQEGIKVSNALFELQPIISPSSKSGVINLGFKWNSKQHYSLTPVCFIVINRDTLMKYKEIISIPVSEKIGGNCKIVYKDSIIEGEELTKTILYSHFPSDTIKVPVSMTCVANYYYVGCHYKAKEKSINFSFNKATAQKITLRMPPSDRYPGNGGAFGLVNGIVSEKGINSTEWLGFGGGQDAEVTIDLGSEQEISQVKVHTLDQQGSWIYLPEGVDIYTSNDGVNFTIVSSATKITDDKNRMKYFENNFAKTNCRYVRIHVKNFGEIPSGKPGGGHQAWLFLDEVQVN